MQTLEDLDLHYKKEVRGLCVLSSFTDSAKGKVKEAGIK